jgi:hypothetical protein
VHEPRTPYVRDAERSLTKLDPAPRGQVPDRRRNLGRNHDHPRARAHETVDPAARHPSRADQQHRSTAQIEVDRVGQGDGSLGRSRDHEAEEWMQNAKHAMKNNGPPAA